MIKLSVIVDRNLGIGNGNKLLAHISNDLKHFKKITKGHTVVMGYNTYLSLPNKPLPGRNNIVLTRKRLELPGVIVLNSVEEVLKYYQDNIKGLHDLFIIGGATIYEQFIEYVEEMYITHILDEFEADAYFPDMPEEEWALVAVNGDENSLMDKHRHLFTVYKRK